MPSTDMADAILAASAQLFHEHGFSATTMDQVAQAVGITKRTLYRHVGSKADLLYLLHDAFASQALVHEISSYEGTPAEQLRSIIARHVDVVADHRLAVTVFFEERRHLLPAHRTEIDLRRRRYESVVVDAIERVAGTAIPSPEAPRPLTQGILGALTGLHHWYSPEGRLAPAAMASTAGDLFVQGLSAPLEPPPLPPRSPRRHDPGLDPVLAASASAFAERGFHGASAELIAREAGVSKGTVFYRFGSKEELLAAVVLGVLEDGLADLEEAGGHRDPAVALTTAVHGLVRLASRQRSGLTVLNEQARFVGPDHAGEIADRQARWLEVLGQVIAGVAAADGRPDHLDLDVVTRLVAGLLHSLHWWYRPTGRVRPAELSSWCSGMLIGGMQG